MNVWTYLSVHSFSLYVPHIWKENIEDTIGITRYNLLLKLEVITANLREAGLILRE